MELPDTGGTAGSKRTGAMLANARIAAGLELVDLARDTRIPLRHLKALEADRHEDLPALPYAIGFVKTFARAVGLDPETTASQFRSETSKSAHVPTPVTLEPLDERRLPSNLLVFGSVAVVVAIIAGLSAWGAGAFDPPLPATTEAPAATQAATAPAPAEPAQTLPAAGAVAPGAVAAVPGAPVPTGPVVLTANEEVWVKIYDKVTGTSVKTGTLAAGESFAVPSDPPGLALWTGKAGALDITIGGRPIPPLGGLVETVRGLSLAPADLIARQAARDAATAAATTPGAGPADAATAVSSSGLKPIATIPVRKPVVAPVPAVAVPAPAASTPGN